MVKEALEAKNVSVVSNPELEAGPPFKMELDQINGRWYLYCANLWQPGWSVLDVTDPSSPEHVNVIEGPDNTMTKQIQIADDLMITSLERPFEGTGPIGDPMDPNNPYEEGAYIWDRSEDPFDPELVAHYETGGNGTHRNFYNGGDYAYMVAWLEGFDKGLLTVLDVSDPSDPVEVTRWWWPGQAPDDDADSEYTFYFHGPAYVQGDRAYLAYGRVGSVILDVSDPTDLELIDRVNIGDAWASRLGVHTFIPLPDTDVAAVVTEVIREEGPHEGGDPLNYAALLDISDERPFGFNEEDGSMDPIGPRYLSTLPLPTPDESTPYDNYYEKEGVFGPHNIHHYRDNGVRYNESDLLFATWSNAGLRIFDISTPAVPREVGYYVPRDPDERVGNRPSTPTTKFEDVVVDTRGYIYCSDPNHGLIVLESSLL